MSFCITEFDIGTDLEQPHNFFKINGMSPTFHLSLEYYQRSNYTKLYEWVNSSDFGLNESWFDSVLTERDFHNNATNVIINSSTAKLKIEFMKNVLLVEPDNAKQQKLKRSLLILDRHAIKPIQIFNLQNGSGEICIYSSEFK